MAEISTTTANVRRLPRRISPDHAGDVDVLAAVIGALEPQRARLDELYAVAPGKDRVEAGDSAEAIIRRCLSTMAMPATVEAAAAEVGALWRCSSAASGAGPSELLADASSMRARAIEDAVLTSAPARTIGDVMARLRWTRGEAEQETLEPDMAADILRVTLADLAHLVPAGGRSA